MKKIEIQIEIEKKPFLIFLSGILIVLSGFFLIKTVNAALSCTVTGTCNSPSVVVFRMSGTSNAHAEMRGQSTAAYASNLVCCGNVTGLGTNCSGTYQLLGTLSGAINAHFEDSLKTNYNSANDICLSITSGTVSVATSTSCASYDTTVFEMSGTDTSGTNAHVGDANSPYATKICASATAVTTYLYLSITGNETFPNVTPGTVSATTSIITVRTNDADGFNVTVARDDADTTLDLATDNTVNITDKTAWNPTTNVCANNDGNATASTTQPLTLQFRVRQAGTEAANYCANWWGSDDTTANAKFAGLPNPAKQIINRASSATASSTSYVLYNLNVPLTQKTGNYTGGLTYTVTANP